MASTAVRAPSGTLYRGREGMWSWVLHRITGVVLFFFLLVHVLDTGLVRVSPEAYDLVIETYKNPIVGLAEVGLVGAFLFHSLNGLRVIAVDFWKHGTRFHRGELILVAQEDHPRGGRQGVQQGRHARQHVLAKGGGRRQHMGVADIGAHA